MTLLIVTPNQQNHVIAATLLALLYFLIVGNKTVPMIVLYVSCDCTTKNGSHIKWLCKQHNVMSEHIE